MNAEDKQALIERCKKYIELNNKRGFVGVAESQCFEIHRIALAALTAEPVKLPEMEHVATLTLKDSQYEWERICHIPDGEHDLYIIKEVQE